MPVLAPVTGSVLDSRSPTDGSIRRGCWASRGKTGLRCLRSTHPSRPPSPGGPGPDPSRRSDAVARRSRSGPEPTHADARTVAAAAGPEPAVDLIRRCALQVFVQEPIGRRNFRRAVDTAACDRSPRAAAHSRSQSAAVVCCALIPAEASATVTRSDWDAAQQRQVVRAGLMANVGRSFQGSAALSAGQANAALLALAGRLGLSSTARARRSPVTVFGFDGLLITQLGLGDVASHVQRVAVSAGLRPPPYFGSEVVARFLGLRYDHPSGTDQLELFPTDPITRAEAAWSLARVLGFGDWKVSYARRDTRRVRAARADRRPAPGAHDRRVADRLPVRVGWDHGRHLGRARPRRV